MKHVFLLTLTTMFLMVFTSGCAIMVRRPYGYGYDGYGYGYGYAHYDHDRDDGPYYGHPHRW